MDTWFDLPTLYTTQAGGSTLPTISDLEEILFSFQRAASSLCSFVRANEEEGVSLWTGGSTDTITVSEDLGSLRLCLLGDLLEKAKRWNYAHSTALSMPPMSSWSLSNAPLDGNQFEFDGVERKMPPLKNVEELMPTPIPSPVPSQRSLWWAS